MVILQYSNEIIEKLSMVTDGIQQKQMLGLDHRSEITRSARNGGEGGVGTRSPKDAVVVNGSDMVIYILKRCKIVTPKTNSVS